MQRPVVPDGHSPQRPPLLPDPSHRAGARRLHRGDARRGHRHLLSLRAAAQLPGRSAVRPLGRRSGPDRAAQPAAGAPAPLDRASTASPSSGSSTPPRSAAKRCRRLAGIAPGSWLRRPSDAELREALGAAAARGGRRRARARSAAAPTNTAPASRSRSSTSSLEDGSEPSARLQATRLGGARATRPGWPSRGSSTTRRASPPSTARFSPPPPLGASSLLRLGDRPGARRGTGSSSSGSTAASSSRSASWSCGRRRRLGSARCTGSWATSSTAIARAAACSTTTAPTTAAGSSGRAQFARAPGQPESRAQSVDSAGGAIRAGRSRSCWRCRGP